MKLRTYYLLVGVRAIIPGISLICERSREHLLSSILCVFVIFVWPCRWVILSRSPILEIISRFVLLNGWLVSASSLGLFLLTCGSYVGVGLSYLVDFPIWCNFYDTGMWFRTDWQGRQIVNRIDPFSESWFVTIRSTFQKHVGD